MHKDKIGSTIREHEIFMQRAWNLLYDILRFRLWENEIYMTRSWDVDKEI